MNSKMLLSIMLLLSIASTKSETAEYRSGRILKKYEAFLDKGTYECQDWSSFQVIPKSRYHTFKQVFSMFE